MNDMLRPALYQAWLDILPVKRHPKRELASWDIVGPVCETADFLGKNRELALASGDLLILSGAGAQVPPSQVRLADPGEVANMGHATVATVVAGGQAPDDIASRSPVALLVGNEAHGLPADMVAACDTAVTIPMTGKTESLNAAFSGAIAMYALSQSRPSTAR
jgi:tRNA G18 (ribose-2'-O)-methylase SpoU